MDLSTFGDTKREFRKSWIQKNQQSYWNRFLNVDAVAKLEGKNIKEDMTVN